MTTWWQRWRGIGGASPAIPPLDGPYDANNALEEGDALLRVDAPDNLFKVGGQLQFTSGTKRMAIIGPGEAVLVEDHGTEITAAAGDGGDSGVVALSGGTLLRVGLRPDATSRIGTLDGDITALAFDREGAILACIGSSKHGLGAWTRDLLEKRREGSLWRLDPRTAAATKLSHGLAYPCGVLSLSNGSVVVAEAWRHRLVEVLPGGRTKPLASDLPGYPARLISADGGGAWLAVMAPRNQLVEFVLREDEYRNRMLSEIDPAHWIAPSLTRARSFLEPMQQGAQRSLGTLKPWAPSMSIGLVIRFSHDWAAQYSLFSRADGTRHGIRSVLRDADRLLATSIGAGEILSLPLSKLGERI
ncbi:MAG: strictosidine synthase [Rhizobiaceae bacterium]|nr:strictosidine synthase [Rhizobiaceae bacterium]